MYHILLLNTFSFSVYVTIINNLLYKTVIIRDSSAETARMRAGRFCSRTQYGGMTVKVRDVMGNYGRF